jgi:YgiT-type zinc finger domain-containing protein
MDETAVRSRTSVLGTCPCTGIYQRRFVEVRIKVSGETVVLRSVPQGACPQCGSRIYKARVLQALETLFKSA